MIGGETLLVVQAVCTVMAMFSIICRAAKMTRATPGLVRWQHGVLFAGLSFSLVLPAVAGNAALAMGALGWLTLSAHRWRYGVPAEIAAASHGAASGQAD